MKTSSRFLSSVLKWVSSKHPNHNAVDKTEAECSAALSVNSWHCANRNVVLKSLGRELNRKLCVCVNLMRAFPSTNASYGCIQHLFNAKSVFTIVWIHIFPSFHAKMYLKMYCSQFFYNDQELALILLALLLKLTILLTFKIDQIILKLDFWEDAVCWKRALGLSSKPKDFLAKNKLFPELFWYMQIFNECVSLVFQVI